MARKRLSRKDKAQKKLEQKKKRTQRLRSFIDLIMLRKHSDIYINVAVFVLILFGTFMIVSTNVGQTTTNSTVVLTTQIKQIAFLFAAYFCMWIVNHVFSFRWFSKAEMMFILFMSVFMMMPFAFSASGGSQAWIRLPGGITIQPSEFTKPLLIVLIACAVYKAKRNPKLQEKWSKLFRFPIYALVLDIIFLILQRDLGTMSIVAMIFFVCILIPDYPSIQRIQKNLKRLFTVSVLGVVVLFGITDIGTDIIAQTPFSHVATRIENAKNPYNDIYGEGYQPANSLYGIASSNIIGKGIGASARKYGYLTQADNDYILAVTIEETGVFGLGLIVLLYGVIIYRLFYYAFKTNETVYKIVLVGNATYLFMHFFLNVGGVAALIPFTGVPLLFISSGGSSLMAICTAIGLSQQCISQIRVKEMNA